MAEKLALIDKDLLLRLLSRRIPASAPSDPVLEKMERIDDQLQSALTDTKTPERQKSDNINRLLTSHDAFHKQYDSKFGVSPGGAGAAAAQSWANHWKNKTLDAAPPTQKKMTENLMDHIQSSNRMAWDAQGRLVVDGVTVPNTNILDLVHSIVRKRKKIPIPTGGDKFFNALNEINTPRELLPNAQLYSEAYSRPTGGVRRTSRRKKTSETPYGAGAAASTPGPTTSTPQKTSKKSKRKKRQHDLEALNASFFTPNTTAEKWEPLYN